jgi:hypothetical protein
MHYTPRGDLLVSLAFRQAKPIFSSCNCIDS